MLIARAVVAVGLLAVLSQTFVGSPSMPVLWGGLAVAFLAGVRIADGNGAS